MLFMGGIVANHRLQIAYLKGVVCHEPILPPTSPDASEKGCAIGMND
jgi:hypothetical protein